MSEDVSLNLEWGAVTPAQAAEAFEEFEEQCIDNLEAKAEELALRIQRDAQRLVNVDTGRLRASIDHELERVMDHMVRVTVGSNVEYAPFHEMDYPFLRPAFERNESRIRSAVQQALTSAWEAVGP
jgi:hypothetical protein